jgi:hypothetical protein
MGSKIQIPPCTRHICCILINTVCKQDLIAIYVMKSVLAVGLTPEALASQARGILHTRTKFLSPFPRICQYRLNGAI